MKGNKLKKKYVITIYGEKNIGKTTITAHLARAFEEKKFKKILIIDFDISNLNIYYFFNKQK